MKRKNDQRDHAHSNNRSADEIKRSKTRSTRSQNFKKFSTGVADSARVGVADSATVGVADSATVSDIGVAESATVSDMGVADSATPEKKGYLIIYKNLTQKMRAEIKNKSAFFVYHYLYEIAFEWIHDDRVKVTINIDLADIMTDCYMASRVVRDALKYLEEIGWISIEKRPGMSSIYTIYRPKPDIPSKGDHDLLNNHDLNNDLDNHLQKDAKDDDSLSIIKKVYKDLTKNTWTNQDTKNYQSLPKNLQTEDIIRYMRAISERIKKPIGSFAYFVKSILRELESPKNKKATVTKLRKIAESIKTANIGGKPVSTTDFIEQIKEIAAQEGIPYTPDLLEEALKTVMAKENSPPKC